MTDVLLNYVMPVTRTVPLAAPNLQYLQNALVVFKYGESGTKNEIKRITSKADLDEIGGKETALEFTDGGRSYFYAVSVDSLDLSSAEILNPNKYEYFTILIDPAFTDDEVGSLVLPDEFHGVVSGCSTDDAFVANQNKKDRFAWFFQAEETAGGNMYKAFGSLLNKPKNRWTNQQYLEMNHNDNITLLATADALFDSRANFVLTGEQYGNRLALFCCGSLSGGADAIIAPYLYEEIKVTMQGRALRYINLNEPQYTIAEAALLQGDLQGYADQQADLGYWPRQEIKVNVGNEQFIMNGQFNVQAPTALWRVKVNMVEGGLE